MLQRIANLLFADRHATHTVQRDDSWGRIAGVPLYSPGSPNSHEQVAAVFACIDLISSTIATFTPRVVGQDGSYKNYLDRVFDKPNPHHTWPEFVSWFVAECLIYGNALSELGHNGEVGSTSIMPLRWREVQPYSHENGTLSFRLGGNQLSQGRTLVQDEVIHLKDRDNGDGIGVARMTRANEVVSIARQVQSAVVSTWENGAMPSGVLTSGDNLSLIQRNELKANIKSEFQGVSNVGNVMMMPPGTDWKPMSVSPKDAELLATRQWMIAEICRIFNVPPPLIQDYAHNTFTNAATAGRWFSRGAIHHWTTRLEAVLGHSLCRMGDKVHLDRSDLIREEPTERWVNYEKAINLGVLTAEEVRQMEFPNNGNSQRQ